MLDLAHHTVLVFALFLSLYLHLAPASKNSSPIIVSVLSAASDGRCKTKCAIGHCCWRNMAAGVRDSCLLLYQTRSEEQITRR